MYWEVRYILRIQFVCQQLYVEKKKKIGKLFKNKLADGILTKAVSEIELEKSCFFTEKVTDSFIFKKY